jgi:prephenate dehydratase
MRVAYLGPAGTYTHEALLSSAQSFAVTQMEALAQPTIHDVVTAVELGAADRGLVPIENSVEGSVNATLDALAFDSTRVRIVGETVLAIHHCLIGRAGQTLDVVELVLSHPQALAQCAGFVRTRLPAAMVRAEASTAEAVRAVVEGGHPWAALGPRSAAERYGGAVLAEDVEDVAGNETRFAWLARADDLRIGSSWAGAGGAGASGAGAAGGFKTAAAFWPRESDHAGWLVDCLSEFSRRGVNLTRIESRPRKVGLGEYVFFIDVEGAADDAHVAAALEGVESHVAQLRVLGSFPAA